MSESHSDEEKLEAEEYSARARVFGLPKAMVARLTGFDDPNQKWRRWFSEFMGTFLLVAVAAGAGMVNQRFDDSVGRVAAVIAPGLMVMAMIMFMGKVSGAHFNPVVSIAFALRGDFPWHRVPPYLIAQLLGALTAAAFLQVVIDTSAAAGSTYPGAGVSTWSAILMEALLTFGLLSVILGTASGAQNIGIIGALGVGGYIALAGLWASPFTGASMNPFRTLGPDVVAWDFSSYWVYVIGPLMGGLLAVGAAWLLRGPGGGKSGSLTAQGVIHPIIAKPEKE
jgi:aquaporin Z